MPNQNAIASMANVSRETVSRALGALVRAGVIRKDGRKLWVQDPMVLKRLASGEIGLDNIPNPPNPGARQVPGQQAGRRLVVQLQPRVIRRSQPSNPD
jgi:DNA-binding transcriptional MocR family regulator